MKRIILHRDTHFLGGNIVPLLCHAVVWIDVCHTKRPSVYIAIRIEGFPGNWWWLFLLLSSAIAHFSRLYKKRKKIKRSLASDHAKCNVSCLLQVIFNVVVWCFFKNNKYDPMCERIIHANALNVHTQASHMMRASRKSFSLKGKKTPFYFITSFYSLQISFE